MTKDVVGINNPNYKHGLRHTPAYRSWASMKTRCTNPNQPCYKRYGGKGITYPKHWETFEGFIIDMGLPDKNLKQVSLDRIDSNKSYSKENCRWLEMVENGRLGRHKPVQQFTMDGEFIAKYPSTTHAAKACNGKRSGIARAARKERNHYYNYVWHYA